VLEPILVINPGSSSIKFSVFATTSERSLLLGAHGEVENLGTSAHLKVTDANGRTLTDQQLSGGDHEVAIAAINQWFAAHIGSSGGQFAAVGHRVVHGGAFFAQSVLIDSKVLAEIEALTPLAPLHQPDSLAVIRAVTALAPKVPQVACFDTAFHHDQPALAQQFALPRALTAKGLRRYGFHGLSYEFIVSVLPELAPECAAGKIVVAHLGNGASMCAIDRGRSIATTMALTPVDGLMMGTRSGSLDPGVILFLLQHEGMAPEAIEELIYRRSGLLGVSGLSHDMRALLASNAASAKEAIALFVYRIGRELGSLVAAMGGIDALIFTGGIGEHAAEVRARVSRDAAWLGVTLDETANHTNSLRISAPNSAISVLVIASNENLIIGRHTRRLLDQG
jgi:acetate kinase